MRTTFHKRLVFLVLLGLLLFPSLAGCGNAAGDAENGQYKILTEMIFLENGRGSYTLAEFAVPENYMPAGAEGQPAGAEGQPAGAGTGGFPMVAVAHGFTGTMDSGGAAELIRRLAGAGIAAVRVDFDPYLTPEKNSDPSNRACEYTLRDMEDDLTLALQYACSHYRIDETRLGVYGRSMGGRVAMMMANESYGGFEYQAMALVAPAGNDRAMIYFMGGQQRWEEMKAQAAADGYVQYKQLRLRPDWFAQFEDYDPCTHGDSFGDKPVLVICNTLDHVVTDETSRQCAAAYENSRIIEVTTEDGHGYEMSRKDSDLKDMLMDEIVAHFAEKLS